MELGGEQGLNVGAVTVVGSDAPSDYHVAPRTATESAAVALPKSELVLSPATMTMTMTMKRKRGRPRKYGPDGTPTRLSPKPISSLAPHPHPPPFIDFSGKIRSLTKAPKMQRRIDAESSGEWGTCSVGATFTPHMVFVNIGEEITMKVISFAQQVPRAICILSASGLISSVTFRQPDSCGGTLTYEGRFEILSLAGSFMPSDIGGTREQSWRYERFFGMPRWMRYGRGSCRPLSRCQFCAVVGSFLTGNRQEQRNTTKQLPEFNATSYAPSVAVRISIIKKDESYNGIQEQHIPVSTKQVFTPSAPFRCDTWPSVPADIIRKQTDINIPLHG